MKKIKLNYLGKNKNLLNNPDRCLLDPIPNKNYTKNYVVRLTVNEFTSLCPITGQPDFAKFIIDYLPNKYLVESKSFKFFMYWFPRGGIPIDIFYENKKAPKNLYIPDTGIEPYKGR